MINCREGFEGLVLLVGFLNYVNSLLRLSRRGISAFRDLLSGSTSRQPGTSFVLVVRRRSGGRGVGSRDFAYVDFRSCGNRGYFT